MPHPAAGRAPFLGVWRLLSLVGHNGAAIVVGAVAAVATIGVASVTVGVLTLPAGPGSRAGSRSTTRAGSPSPTPADPADPADPAHPG